MSFDFSAIQDAGITQEQFARLVGVTRVTVNTWTTGRFKPRTPIRARVRMALTLLRGAVNRGHLPVTDDHRTALVERRLAAVETVLNKRA